MAASNPRSATIPACSSTYLFLVPSRSLSLLAMAVSPRWTQPPPTSHHLAKPQNFPPHSHAHTSLPWPSNERLWKPPVARTISQLPAQWSKPSSICPSFLPCRGSSPPLLLLPHPVECSPLLSPRISSRAPSSSSPTGSSNAWRT